MGTIVTAQPGEFVKNSTTPEAFGAVGNDSSNDDSPAIEAAIAAMVDGCIGDGSYVCEVVFDSGKVYYATRAPVANPIINGSDSYAYAQIALPYLPWSYTPPDSTPLVTLILRSGVVGQAGNTTFNAQPSAIKTTPTSGAGLSSGSAPSVLGGPARGSSPSGGRSGYHIIVDGLNIISPTNPQFTGLDFYGVNTVDIRSAHCFVPTDGYGAPTLCSNPAAWGVILPEDNNGGNIKIGTLGVYGYFTGLSLSEHLTADNVMLYWNQCALGLDQTGTHEARVSYLQTEGNTYDFGASAITSDAVDSCVSGCAPLVVDLWGLESALVGLDAGDYAQITANYYGAGTGPSSQNLTGASKCRFTNLAQPRGASTAPTIPVSGTALTNAYGRDAWVIVSGGTVTEIVVDGQDTGLTSGQILVPNGKTIIVTYSAAPTWAWWLF